MMTWNDFKAAVGTKALATFNGIWYQGKPLDEEALIFLKPLFDKYPLGEDNIKIWAKRVVRQSFEDSIKKETNRNG